MYAADRLRSLAPRFKCSKAAHTPATRRDTSPRAVRCGAAIPERMWTMEAKPLKVALQDLKCSETALSRLAGIDGGGVALRLLPVRRRAARAVARRSSRAPGKPGARYPVGAGFSKGRRRSERS